MDYLARCSDRILSHLLDAFGAVLIEGPKWCGKTTTASRQAKSIIKFQDPDFFPEYIATAETKPSLLLAGAKPRLIDEWQDIPLIWDAIRNSVDQTGLPGQFILTGSNSVKKEKLRHSGSGRIVKMEMLPMSLWESKDSSGTISIHNLFDHPDEDIDGHTSPLSIEDLIFCACRGGWPASLHAKDKKSALLIAHGYVQSLCERDISKVDGRDRNPLLAKTILRSYARNISTLAKKSSILKDIQESEVVNCSQDTFDDYISAFERLYIIQNLPAWCPSIRSKTTIRSTPKKSFCDPSITVGALGLSPEMLITQLKTFGFIFEQMCIRDLKAYTADLMPTVSYYRDRYGLESDLVLHLHDGRYALIECKLGSRDIEMGAEHLIELRNLIRKKNETERQNPLREPDLMIVLTGGKMAYTRPDGVKIIPLGCLKE